MLCMFCCDKRESPQFALDEVNSPRYEIAYIDLELVDFSCGRTGFKWPFKGYLFFVETVQDTREYCSPHLGGYCPSKRSCPFQKSPDRTLTLVARGS